VCCRYIKINSPFHCIFLVRIGNASENASNGKQLLMSLEESVAVQLILEMKSVDG
jgi:hypothetical protein